MSRPAVLAFVVLLGAAGGKAAHAGAPSTSLPLCWPPEKAAMGAWTTYTISIGQPKQGLPTIQMEERVALVGRSRVGPLVESESRMAHVPGAPRLVMQLALADGDTSGNARRLLVQVEDGQPLDASAQRTRPEMPVPDFMRANAGRADDWPRARLALEGKPIETKVLEARDGDGLVWRVWCSERVQPLGVVRLEVSGQRKGQPIAYQMNATATGSRATRRVVGKSVPYTDEALFGQLSRAALVKPTPAAKR